MKLKESIFNIHLNEGIIYNSYSGAIARMDKPISCYLDNESDRVELIKQGFLVPNEINEINRFILNRFSKMYSDSNHRLKYVIALTNDCQAYCSYCFERGISRTSYMNKSAAQKVLKYITNQVEKCNATSLQITFFGGEPLLNFEILEFLGKELNQFCDDKKIPYYANVITNGIRLNENKARELADIGVKFIQITLDGTREEYQCAKGIDAFDAVINNIKVAANIIPVDVRLNITRLNAENIKLLLDELLDKYNLAGKIQITLAQVEDYFGCEYNSALCLDGSEYGQYVQETYKEYAFKSRGSLKAKQVLPKVLRTFCGMENLLQYVIGPDGELYKCEHNVGKKNEVVGNVEIGSFFNDNEMEFYSQIPNKCIEEKCAFLPMCVGGCVNERLHNSPITECNQIKQKNSYMLNTYLSLFK